MTERFAEATKCPRVSVITPFLDNAAFLPEAVESVLAQTFKDWEYLLVDDGSGPEATSIAKQYAKRYPGRIRYLEHSGHLNRGISASRNLGVKHAQGEFIAFLDSDDVWLPAKLAKHVAVLDAHQEVGMVSGSTVLWGSWSAPGTDKVFLTAHRTQNVVVNPPDAALQLFPLGPDRTASFSDVVFRSSLVRQLGGFDERFTGLYDDQVLLLKVYLSTPVYFCSEVSNKYRQHPASTCAKAGRDGTAANARLFFLEWLEEYVDAIGKVDPRVVSSLRRALRSFRHPHIHYFFSASTKLANWSRRVIGRARRLPAKIARGVRQRNVSNGSTN